MTMLHKLYLKGRVNLARFIADENGASGIEYALLAAMVAAVLALFVPGVGAQITATMNDILVALGGTAI